MHSNARIIESTIDNPESFPPYPLFSPIYSRIPESPETPSTRPSPSPLYGNRVVGVVVGRPPLPHPLVIIPVQDPDRFNNPLVPIGTVRDKDRDQSNKPTTSQRYLPTVTTISITYKLAVPNASTDHPMSSTGLEAEWCFATIQDKIPTTEAWSAKAALSNPECTLLL
jgi:hypothetical protein